MKAPQDALILIRLDRWFVDPQAAFIWCANN